MLRVAKRSDMPIMSLSLADKTTPKSNLSGQLRAIEIPILDTVDETSPFHSLSQRYWIVILPSNSDEKAAA